MELRDHVVRKLEHECHFASLLQKWTLYVMSMQQRWFSLVFTALCGQCRGLYCGNAEETEIADEGNDDLDDIDTPWNIHGIEYTGIEVVL